jgi:hypothetical protein
MFSGTHFVTSWKGIGIGMGRAMRAEWCEVGSCRNWSLFSRSSLSGHKTGEVGSGGDSDGLELEVGQSP